MRRFAVLTLALLLAAGFAFFRLTSPHRGFQGEVFLEFPKGTSATRMAAMLEEAGVIRARWEFLLARIVGQVSDLPWAGRRPAPRGGRGRTLQAGEYRFAGPASPLEVYGRIARGEVFYYELLVPEGKNMFDIAAAAEKLGLFPAAKFLAAARDPGPVRDLDPLAPTLEGFLFPNTYRLGRHTTPQGLCRIMTGKFREVWSGLGAHASVHDTVTLASLVEKEGKLAAERPVIAAVFLNRLRIGMKLDCDPTTIYAAQLEHRYRGVIHKSDLESGNPYNTYRRAGLPPGPIANPGLASIRAVLAPAQTGALYFVLRPDGTGGHAFSANIADHEAAIGRYRRGHR